MEVDLDYEDDEGEYDDEYDDEYDEDYEEDEDAEIMVSTPPHSIQHRNG